MTALGKPTIAVISMEGAYALASVIEAAGRHHDYYGGPYHGDAIAEAIFGVTNRRQVAIHASAARGADAAPRRPEMGSGDRRDTSSAPPRRVCPLVASLLANDNGIVALLRMTT